MRSGPGLGASRAPYSPELQPSEHLWALCDAVLVNRCFETLDELQAVLTPHLVHLTQQLHRIRSLTLFRLWPTTGSPPDQPELA